MAHHVPSEAAALRLERAGYDHPDARRLIAEVQAEYVVRYGGEDDSPIDPLLFELPHGSFFVGYVADEAIASGAWRRSEVGALGSERTAEIKRMYVAQAWRGRGFAREVLRHLEGTAARAGVEVMILETGLRQPEAIGLYESSGYAEIPGFGYYRDSPLSRCFARRITDDSRRPSG